MIPTLKVSGKIMHSEMLKQEIVTFKSRLRDKMIEMLGLCTSPQRDLFRRMYNYEGIYARDVDGVRDEQMDNAFSQIETTLIENAKKGNTNGK